MGNTKNNNTKKRAKRAKRHNNAPNNYEEPSVTIKYSKNKISLEDYLAENPIINTKVTFKAIQICEGEISLDIAFPELKKIDERSCKKWALNMLPFSPSVKKDFVVFLENVKGDIDARIRVVEAGDNDHNNAIQDNETEMQVINGADVVEHITSAKTNTSKPKTNNTASSLLNLERYDSDSSAENSHISKYSKTRMPDFINEADDFDDEPINVPKKSPKRKISESDDDRAEEKLDEKHKPSKKRKYISPCPKIFKGPEYFIKNGITPSTSRTAQNATGENATTGQSAEKAAKNAAAIVTPPDVSATPTTTGQSAGDAAVTPPASGENDEATITEENSGDAAERAAIVTPLNVTGENDGATTTGQSAENAAENAAAEATAPEVVPTTPPNASGENHGATTTEQSVGEAAGDAAGVTPLEVATTTPTTTEQSPGDAAALVTSPATPNATVENAGATTTGQSVGDAAGDAAAVELQAQVTTEVVVNPTTTKPATETAGNKYIIINLIAPSNGEDSSAILENLVMKIKALP